MGTDGQTGEVDGHVVGIYTTTIAATPVVARPQVLAVAGRGLEGDRHFAAEGDGHDPADEITLIDADGVHRAGADHGVVFAPGEHRRQIEVSGLDLPALIGRTIRVGDIEVEVLEKSNPCKHLAELTGKPVLKILRHQGGVSGRIVTTGTIRTGDPVTG